MRACRALTDSIATAEGEKVKPKQSFEDYEPGFIYIDIRHRPQMPDENPRRYLFVAFDRATRWVLIHLYGDMSKTSSVDFLRRLKPGLVHQNQRDPDAALSKLKYSPSSY